jgi:hypothetical protein
MVLAEAPNGMFQVAKRKARGCRRFSTIRTVLFLLTGKFDFPHITPHVPAHQPCCDLTEPKW